MSFNVSLASERVTNNEVTLFLNPVTLPNDVVLRVLDYVRKISDENIDSCNSNQLTRKYLSQSVSFLKTITSGNRIGSVLSGQKLSHESILKKVNSYFERRSEDLSHVSATDICAIEYLMDLAGKVTYLDLSGLDLVDYPLPVNLFQQVKVLSLRFNNLKSLSGMGTLKNLAHFDVTYTPLRDLTPITKSTNVRELYVSDSQLEHLPENLSDLKNLERLDCSNNQINTPPDLSVFNNLIYVNFEGNPFEGAGTFKKFPASGVAVQKQCCSIM